MLHELKNVHDRILLCTGKSLFLHNKITFYFCCYASVMWYIMAVISDGANRITLLKYGKTEQFCQFEWKCKLCKTYFSVYS